MPEEVLNEEQERAKLCRAQANVANEHAALLRTQRENTEAQTEEIRARLEKR